ncbi:MAG: hypothetical protein ACK4NZ_10260 [Tsuneonella sp.]
MTFLPLQRRAGRIAYRRRGDHGVWGAEDFAITRDREGNRTLVAHCEMAFGQDDVVRETTLTVDVGFQPLDAYVRILNHGRWTGSGWFHFGESEASGHGWNTEDGEWSTTTPLKRPMRGFGIHALIGDGWLAAAYPFDKGPGSEHFFGTNLLHSLHHFGATGPRFATSTSGLQYEGIESITVPAGAFDCHRFCFIGMTNNHPPYTLWIGADGDFLYVRGVVEGYMDSVFELEELD